MQRCWMVVLGMTLFGCESSPAAAPAPVSAKSRDARPIQVLFLGHSLIGHDMPQMLDDLAESRGGAGRAQLEAHAVLGWGSSLQAQWTFNGHNHQDSGFDKENRPPLYPGKPGREALATGAYDVLVMTEVDAMLEGRLTNTGTFDRLLGRDDWFDTADYARRFTELARKHRPDVRIYLYACWLARDTVDAPWFKGDDWARGLREQLPLWEEIAREVNEAQGAEVLRVLPVSLVWAEAIARIEQGQLGTLASADALFKDNTHPSPVGTYLLSLVMYTALFERDPSGLPAAARMEDGTLVNVPEPTARAMQSLVWQVLTGYAPLGLGSGARSS